MIIMCNKRQFRCDSLFRKSACAAERTCWQNNAEVSCGCSAVVNLSQNQNSLGFGNAMFWMISSGADLKFMSTFMRSVPFS